MKAFPRALPLSCEIHCATGTFTGASLVEKAQPFSPKRERRRDGDNGWARYSVGKT